MKNKKIIISLAVALAVIVAAFAIIVITNKPETETGDKQITVTVVYEDKSEKDFTIDTNAEFLGDALFEKKLITEEDKKAGFITYLDGIRADYTKDGVWWCVTKGGEMTEKGINELVLKDGDKFEIRNTPS